MVDMPGGSDNNGPPDRPHKSDRISNFTKRLAGLRSEKGKKKKETLDQLMNEITHLDKTKPGNDVAKYPEKVRELNQEYQKTRRELEVLTRDSRVEKFNGKTQTQNRDTYEELPPDFIANSQTELAYEQTLIQVKAWRDRMKNYIEKADPPKKQEWQESFSQISLDLHKLEQEITSKYGDLINDEQRRKLKVAKDRKEPVRKLRQDYRDIGKVAIGPDYENNMDQALEQFRQATDDVKNVLDNLKEKRADATFHDISTHLSDLTGDIDSNYADTINTLEDALQSGGLFNFRQNNAIKYRNEAIAAIGDGQDNKKIEQALSTFRIATDEIKRSQNAFKAYQDIQFSNDQGAHQSRHLRVTTTGLPEVSSPSPPTHVAI